MRTAIARSGIALSTIAVSTIAVTACLGASPSARRGDGGDAGEIGGGEVGGTSPSSPAAGPGGSGGGGSNVGGGGGFGPTCGHTMLCGRGDDGLACATYNGTGFDSATLWADLFRDSNGWSSPISTWGTIRLADVNGDGSDDVCGRSTSGIVCLVSNGVDGFEVATSSLWTTDFSNASIIDDGGRFWSTLQFADLNADGAQDVCAKLDDGLHCALSNGKDGFGPANLWSDQFSDSRGWNVNTYWGTIQLPDVNGDGRADVCGRSTLGVVCGVSNGTTFLNVSSWTSAMGDGSGWQDVANALTIQFPDVNGDGDADVCGRGNDAIVCAVSDGLDSFDDYGVWVAGASDAGGFTDVSRWGTVQFPDVNGDGAADVCWRDALGIFCGVSNETDLFSPVTMWSTAFGDADGWGALEARWSTVRFVDVDGDGAGDVCGHDAEGIVCGLSDKSGSFGAIERFTTDFAGDYDTDPSHYRNLWFGKLSQGRCSDDPSWRLPWGSGALFPRVQ